MVDLANSHTRQWCSVRFDSWKRWFFCRAATHFFSYEEEVWGCSIALCLTNEAENDVLQQQLFPTVPPPLQVFLA